MDHISTYRQITVHIFPAGATPERAVWVVSATRANAGVRHSKRLASGILDGVTSHSTTKDVMRLASEVLAEMSDRL